MEVDVVDELPPMLKLNVGAFVSLVVLPPVVELVDELVGVLRFNVGVVVFELEKLKIEEDEPKSNLKGDEEFDDELCEAVFCCILAFVFSSLSSLSFSFFSLSCFFFSFSSCFCFS